MERPFNGGISKNPSDAGSLFREHDGGLGAAYDRVKLFVIHYERSEWYAD
jgi:hypothetical protein